MSFFTTPQSLQRSGRFRELLNIETSFQWPLNFSSPGAVASRHIFETLRKFHATLQNKIQGVLSRSRVRPSLTSFGDGWRGATAAKEEFTPKLRYMDSCRAVGAAESARAAAAGQLAVRSLPSSSSLSRRHRRAAAAAAPH